MVPLMSVSLERRLGMLEHLKLSLHLLVCAWCARYLRQIKLLRQVVHQRTSTNTADNASPVRLTDEARQRISESLRHSV